MTTVTIMKSWRVNIDAMNHTLERLTKGGKNPKTGEISAPRWTVEGYFPNMALCIGRVIEQESAKGNDTRTLEQHRELWESLIEQAKSIKA